MKARWPNTRVVLIVLAMIGVYVGILAGAAVLVTFMEDRYGSAAGVATFCGLFVVGGLTVAMVLDVRNRKAKG